MGNVHSVYQMEPIDLNNGAAIRVIRKYNDVVIDLHNSLEDSCYTYLEHISINSKTAGCFFGDTYDFNDLLLYFVIQDNNKFRCGPDDFLDNLKLFSKYLEDAYFGIEDEYGEYSAEFKIIDGEVIYKDTTDEER